MTLNFYRDCNGVAAPTNCNNGLEFRVRSNSCNANFTQCFGNDPTVQVITPICPTETDRCVSASGTYGVERYTYTKIVDLSAYAACGGADWEIYWSLCCRNNAITSLHNPGNQNLYLNARLNDGPGLCNSSTTFTNSPSAFFCLGEPISYNPGAVDPDGDSLVYALIPARTYPGTAIPYQPGYSAAQPIKNNGGADAVVLDPQTGTMIVTPSILQVAVVCYQVTEYRNGVMVGQTSRDVQVVVRPCSGNSAPTASGINGTGAYNMTVCAGTPVSFTVNSNDVNAGQVVTMNWNAGIPTANFSVSGSPHPTGTFTWTPTAANIGNNTFTAHVQDNGCPLIGSNDFGFSINVTPPVTDAEAGPAQSVCGGNATLAGVLPYPGVQGTWTVVSGTGTFANLHAANTSVSGLSTGANVFQWTVDYLTCGTRSDQVTVTSYNPAQATAAAGPDQQFCLPTNSATLAGNTAVAPAMGTWTLVNGTGVITAPNSPTATVTGLAVGPNRFRWTINNGPCASPTQDEVVITIYSNIQPVANAGPDIAICSTTSTVTMNGNAVAAPATGAWSLVSGTGTITSPNSRNTTITGLQVGVHVFRWSISNGPCTPTITTDDVTVTVYSASSLNASAGMDQQVCTPGSVTLVGNAPTFPATGVWTVVSGTGTLASPNAASTLVSALGIGPNVFQWTVNNGPCSNGVTSDQVTVTSYDQTVSGSNAGPDQFLCTPITSTTMAANAPASPAQGTWTLISGSGTITAIHNATTAITGLAIGENVFRWDVSNGPCPVNPPNDLVSIFVYDVNAPVAQAGPDQQLCTPTLSANLAGNAATAPGIGTWTVLAGTGIFANTHDPATVVSGLSVGTNTLRWAFNNGPCANPVTNDDVTIVVFNSANAVANAGPDQELCRPTTSTTLSGSALSTPSTGQWTLVSGSGTIVSPNSPATQVTGLATGDNIFRWTVSNGPCANGLTMDDVRIRVYDNANQAANAGIDQQLCSDANTATMAASSLIYPATGNWTLVSGSGTIVNASSPTTVINGLGVGENIFQWNVSNGPCPGSASSDPVSLFVFSSSHPAITVSADQSICVPTSVNQVTVSGTIPVAPATGEWTLVSGSGTIASPNSPSTVITDMGIGVNVFQWTVSNGPCTFPGNSAQVSIRLFNAATPTADAGPDQSLCTPITSTTLAGSVLVGPATGLWTVISGSGVFADATNASTTVSGLSLGGNVFQWSVNNGPCAAPTFDQVTISLFNGSAQQANAGPDQQLCDNLATTVLSANTALAPATGSWSVLQGNATFSGITDPHAVVSDLPVGVNILVWSLDNGGCGTSTDQVSITVYDDADPMAAAGPDQQLCTPATSTTLTGSSLIAPATGLWTMVSGAGNIVSPTSPITQVNGLGAGVNTFRWTVSNGPCPDATTFDEVVINVFTSTALAANAGPDREICTPTTSVTLAANVPVMPAVGTWSVFNGTASFADVHDPNTTATGLQVGTTLLEWTIDNGTCGITSDQISVNVFDVNNPAANAGPDQQFCLPTNSATMGGSSLTAPATGVWTLVSGTGSITYPSSATTTITGMSIGENIFRWTVSNGPCAGPTMQDVSVTIFDNTVSGSDAGPDQLLCTPVTSTTMAASAAPSPAQGTWTLVSGTGIIANANDPQAAVTGLSIGENVFRWSVSNGACPVNPPNDLVSIFLYDASNPLANAGADQQLCTPNTGTTLSGSTVTFPAQGTWTLVSGMGAITDPGDPATAVTGLGTGANVFQWSVTNGPCAQALTTDQVTIFVFDASNGIANAGPDQSFCTPQESTTLAGSTPTFPSTGMWTLIQGTAVITAPGDPHTTVTGLGVGENILAWTVNNGPCSSGLTTDQVSIFLFDANTPNASAGGDQELCSPASSTTFAGSAVTFPAVGTWTLVSGTGVIADINGPTSPVSGLSVGANTFQWTVSNGLCGSTNDQVTIVVYASNNAVADAGPDQEFCDPADVAVMAGSAVTYPATGLWTLVNGSATITDPGSPVTTISDLQIGENIFVWTVTNGPCADPVTTDTVSISVFDHLNLPASAGPDQEMCTPMTSTTLMGSTAIFPAEGTWTVTQGSAVFADLHSPTSDVSGLSVGENILRWTVSNGPCENGISFDEVMFTVFDPGNPTADAGPDQSLCQPDTFTTMAGSAVIFPATGTWTLVTGTGIITDPTSPTTTITGLAVGENVFQWTVLNGPCTNANTSDFVSIFIHDDDNPVASAGNDQQVCTPLTGTTFAGSAVTFPATGHWDLVSGQGNITDPTDPISTVENLGVGENIFSWTVDNGPCGGSTTDQVSIFLFNLNAPSAEAGPDQSFCSPTTTATLGANTPTAPAIGVWALVQGTATIADVNDPALTVSDLSIGENILTWTIDNGVCGITTDSVSIFIHDAGAPPATAGPDQEYCTPQDSTFLTGNLPTFPAQGTWTLVNGAALFVDANDPATKVVGLAIGANTFAWTVDNGPCADAITTDTMTVTIFSDSTAAANAGEDISICLPTNSIQLNADIPQLPATGTWTILNGTGTLTNPGDPHTQITALAVGQTTLLWTLDNGPCPDNGILTDTLTISIFNPFGPVANAGPDISNCTPGDSTLMAANTPLFPAVGTWELVSGTGIIADTHDPTSAITGLSVGSNVFTWSIFNGDCGFGPPTMDTVKIFLFDGNAPGAFAGNDFELCLPMTSVQLFADIPEAPGNGIWTVLSGPGTLADPTDPHTDISGLDVGITTLLWTTYNGPCPVTVPLVDTLNISVYDPFGPAANAGPDMSNCTPNDSVNMAGNIPLFPAQGTWGLVSGTGTIADVHDPTTTINGLTIGDNAFTWTIYNGNCGFAPPTVDTVHVHLFEGGAPPADAGTDLSFCTPVASFNLSGSMMTAPGIGFWSVLSGMATVTDPADPNTAVTSASIGDNILVWTLDNGPCGITTDTMHVVVFDSSTADADAGPDQSLCTPAESTTMAAVPVDLPSVGTWTVTQGAGAFADVNDPNSAVTGVSPGVNIFTWTVENGPCGTGSDQVSIRVYDNTITSASAGPDQELCSPVASVALAATSVDLPATGSWAILTGTGFLSDPTDPNAVLSGVDVGQTVLTWSVDNGPCSAGPLVDTLVVTIFDGQAQATADAGPDQQLCEPGPVDIDMFGNAAIFPAIGTWSTNSDAALITDPADNGTTVTGVGLGSTSFTWTIDNGVCGTTSDDMIVQVFDSSVPRAVAGPDQQICQDTTSTELAATPVTSTATGHWELVLGHGNLTDPTLATTEVTELEEGTNIFVWMVDNGVCGPSSDSVSIVLRDCSTLIVPDAFSPNGDGVNDLFVVQGLEYYPNNSFRVLNRWGSKVYERSPYTNTWTGKSEAKLNWGSELPESTYYFILDPGDGKEVITGYIYLRR